MKLLNKYFSTCCVSLLPPNILLRILFQNTNIHIFPHDETRLEQVIIKQIIQLQHEFRLIINSIKIHLLPHSACAVFPLLRPTRWSLGI